MRQEQEIPTRSYIVNWERDTQIFVNQIQCPTKILSKESNIASSHLYDLNKMGAYNELPITHVTEKGTRIFPIVELYNEMGLPILDGMHTGTLWLFLRDRLPYSDQHVTSAN